MAREDLIAEEERERLLIEVEALLDELPPEGGDLLVYAAAEERDEEAGRLFVSLRIPVGMVLEAPLAAGAEPLSPGGG